MEDGLARDGVLARCNADAEAAKQDVECENARRAAAAVAANAAVDKARAADLARESERKMLAMRERDTRQQQAEAQAEAAARAQSEADYEAQWRAQSANAGGTAAGEEDAVDFAFVPARPALKVAAVEPPRGDVPIVAPELATQDVAIIPRPFRPIAADNNAQPR